MGALSLIFFGKLNFPTIKITPIRKRLINFYCSFRYRKRLDKTTAHDSDSLVMRILESLNLVEVWLNRHLRLMQEKKLR